MSYSYNEDVFIIDSWPDTQEKEKVLVKLIKKLRIYNAPIILCGHYPIKPEIQELVDYYLFDKDNDLLLEKDFEEYQVYSDRWTTHPSYTLVNRNNFHHDYAIWLTMKNAFSFAKQLGKKYIHFLEFDNLPEERQYHQAFMEQTRYHDAVIYEYSPGSANYLTSQAPFCATFIFSIRTDIALQIMDQVNSKEEYFKNRPNGWQLEKVFYQSLLNVTKNIHVSRYIPNEDELNIFAAFNRNGILRNNARFQIYLGTNNNNQLYVHFISGIEGKLADRDYLVEIEYGTSTRFYLIKKNDYPLVNLGQYEQDKIVKIYYQGVEVFSQTLNEELSEFKRKNLLTFKNQRRDINVNFIDGPFIEILEEEEKTYRVEFVNRKNNNAVFELNLKSNHWARCAIKYYVDWVVKIKCLDDDFYQEYVFNLENSNAFICFESGSLGDSIAWVEYVDKFRRDKKCNVICSTFHNSLFKDQYPDIKFVEPGSTVNNLHALYRLGVFYENDKIDYFRHPTDPKKEPLTKVCSDILGLDYIELKPKLPIFGKNKVKRVSIATHSTAQCKYWNNPTGWQEVVNHLKGKGYEVRLLSREGDGYMGNNDPKGIVQQPKSTIEEIAKVIQESELFIGISSGLSWLSWACGTKTILISGFTDVYLEPFEGINRIINKNVCNGCWHEHEFNKGDWNWCPVHQNTDRQFECSKTITAQQVINEIDLLLS